MVHSFCCIKRILKNMAAEHSYLLGLLTASLTFCLRLEYGRTEDSFDCRSKINTTSVKITCCSKIMLQNSDKIIWRKNNDSIGRCNRMSSTSFNYFCYSSFSCGHRCQFETCGQNCFSLTISELEETDLGEYYISVYLSSVNDLALTLTSIESDFETASVTRTSPKNDDQILSCPNPPTSEYLTSSQEVASTSKPLQLSEEVHSTSATESITTLSFSSSKQTLLPSASSNQKSPSSNWIWNEIKVDSHSEDSFANFNVLILVALILALICGIWKFLCTVVGSSRTK